MDSACLLCGGAPLTRSHFVPRAIREQLPKQATSYTIIGETDLTTPQPVLSLIEQSYGRGAFDTQPRVLCADCNNAWMTRFEDIAAPLLARMIGSSDPFSIAEGDARAVANWAFAALIIRSTVDKGIPRLSPKLMERFRSSGADGVQVHVAVLSMANTRALFSRIAIGSTYIADRDAPHESAMALLFFDTIVVAVGVGKFADMVGRAVRVSWKAVALAWPWRPESSSWPTHSEMLDSALLPSLGVQDFSRSMFVAPMQPRGRQARSVIRVPEAFLSEEITTDQQLILAMDAFEEIAARRLAQSWRNGPGGGGSSAP